MKPDYKKIILCTVLILLSLISLYRGFNKFNNSSTPQEEETTVENVVLSVLPELKERKIKPIEDAGWKRNPFLMESQPTKEHSSLVLSGVSWDEGIPLALINDEILKVGDFLEDKSFKVIRITKDSVLLNNGNKNIELFLDN